MTPEPLAIYRPLKDLDIVDGVIIAVDKQGGKFLLEAPDWIHPSFFEEGPDIHNIPILGFTTDKPGVYNVEIMFSLVRNTSHGTRQRWADEVEWYVTGWVEHHKEVACAPRH